MKRFLPLLIVLVAVALPVWFFVLHRGGLPASKLHLTANAVDPVGEVVRIRGEKKSRSWME